ncbi:MAG: DsbC family protein [Salinisphaera sp.]|nr:DsbC family protein [Salinisphaera sp.]
MTEKLPTRILWAALAGLCLSTQALAADLSDPEYRAKVAKQFPGVSAGDITPTPVRGLWQILQGGAVGYITADGRYLLDGDLIDLKADANLSSQTRRNWRVAHLARVEPANMIIYSPSDPKYTITVFTDVECRYCRALHAHLDQFLSAGIRVRYLAYPLAGPHSSAFARAEHVWCAADRKQALTKAFARYAEGKDPVGAADCDNPVNKQFRLAAKTLGLLGTPAVITADGRMLPGGLPAQALIRKITETKSVAAGR